MIDIGNRREVLWDDYLIDNEKTTAKLMMHKPQKKEKVYDTDNLHQTMCASYLNFIKWNGEYYMYYTDGIPCKGNKELTKDFNKEISALRTVCLMKGSDPMNLECPKLGIHEINGSYDNNVILMQTCKDDFVEDFDNFFVFVDENPDCPADEKIKAIAQNLNHKKGFPGFRELWSYTSADGIHFKLNMKISSGDEPFAGLFDSLNTCHYDTKAKVYRAFVRGLHLDYGVAASAQENGLMTAAMEKELAGYGIRDIRYMESKDFKTWTVPKRLEYNDDADYPLYTNNIQKYERAPHMYIGMPTRYAERKEWNMNFEQLGGEENAKIRRERMEISPRHGLAVTDALFMSSRDGLTWNRFHDTFIGAEPEHTYNWMYGDAYLMYNIVETPCDYSDNDMEYSILGRINSSQKGIAQYRYTIRLDGFASYHSGYEISTLETKPFIFDGGELSLNFESSPIGFVYVDILDETGRPIDGYHSCELFGNTTDRTVYFGESKDVSKLAGRPIKLKFTMRCADLYSFIFR